LEVTSLGHFETVRDAGHDESEVLRQEHGVDVQLVQEIGSGPTAAARRCAETVTFLAARRVLRRV
jgi:hypothetical protein